MSWIPNTNNNSNWETSSKGASEWVINLSERTEEYSLVFNNRPRISTQFIDCSGLILTTIIHDPFTWEEGE